MQFSQLAETQTLHLSAQDILIVSALLTIVAATQKPPAKKEREGERERERDQRVVTLSARTRHEHGRDMHAHV